jgi:predicted DNA-binding transcriptional regulator AlpA
MQRNDDDTLMTLSATCAFFGGDRPINPSTLYRGVAAGRFPQPIKIGPNSSRWSQNECRAARLRLMHGRDATEVA